MEQAELEKLVEELESKVDRLRSLYEQYFMGLEKMQPSVAHKDVERRLYVLRRQTIRNTGLRFRFQNILLRYNTYGTYWQRITRQIEEGTYKRDVRRAKDRFGPDARPEPRKRRRRGQEGEEGEVEVNEVDVDFDMDELDVDVELEEAVAAVASFEEEEIQKARAEVARMRAALRAQKVAAEAERLAASAPPAQASEPTLTVEKDERPAARGRGGDADSRTDRPQEGPDEPSTEPKIPVAHPRPAAASVGSGLTYAVRGPKRGSALPPALPIAGPDSQPGRLPAPRVPSPPSSGTSLTGRRPLPRAPARQPSRPSIEPAPRPPSTRPRAPQAPAKAPPPPAISDDRVRQLYGELVETKRKVGESTAALTLDSLGRTLRDSTEKLKQKHAGKNVDFEVTVKDGKAILKPVVK